MKSLDRSQFGPSMLLRFARPDGRLRATNYADPLMKMPVQLVNHRQGVDYFVNQFDNMIQSSISITVDSCRVHTMAIYEVFPVRYGNESGSH